MSASGFDSITKFLKDEECYHQIIVALLMIIIIAIIYHIYTKKSGMISYLDLIQMEEALKSLGFNDEEIRQYMKLREIQRSQMPSSSSFSYNNETPRYGSKTFNNLPKERFVNCMLPSDPVETVSKWKAAGVDKKAIEFQINLNYPPSLRREQALAMLGK